MGGLGPVDAVRRELEGVSAGPDAEDYEVRPPENDVCGLLGGVNLSPNQASRPEFRSVSQGRPPQFGSESTLNVSAQFRTLLRDLLVVRDEERAKESDRPVEVLGASLRKNSISS